MTNHAIMFEATAGGLELTNAILLYQNRSVHHANLYASTRTDAAAFASIHPIEHDEAGQPIVGSGTALSRAHLRKWTEALGRTVRPELLPDNVLVAHPDVLAWWIPEQVRPAYFALSRPPAGLKALATRTSVPVPYPPHLFIATRSGVGVYALPANKRPTADTPVLHSPVLNVFVDGQLCWGNIPKPKVLSIASIPEFERAVFDSWSTHPNPGQELTVSGKGGLVRLWDDLAARRAKRFPVGRLKPFTVVHGRAHQATAATTRVAMTVGMLIRGAW
jgi:PRTRC genetic system protein B